MENIDGIERISATDLKTLRKDFPTMDLLPSDIFCGAADIGSAPIRTQELDPLYGKDSSGHSYNPSDHNTEALPHLEDVMAEAERTGFLPIGTSFYWNSALSETSFEGTAIAFDAFFALLARYAAQNGTFGHEGYRASIQLDDLDAEKALQKYDPYLLDNTPNVIDGMRLTAEIVTYK